MLSTGYTLSLAKEKSIFDLVPASERKIIERTWDDIIHGIHFEGQIRLITNRGEEKWYRGTFTSVNDMYDEVAKVVFIANDITREKHMEIETKLQTEQLKKQEEMLRLNEVDLNKKLKEARDEVKNQFKEIEKVKIRNEKTLEGFLDAIITTDHDGVIQFFNRASEELFAVKRDEVLGQNIRILFPEDVASKDDFIAAYFDSSKEKMVGMRREINITTRDGKEIPVLILLTEAKLGREVTYTAFIQNISVDLF